MDTNLEPMMGLASLVKAFAAVLVGGAGNVWGALLSFPSLRLTGDYFGIATLAFGEMARLFFLNERWLTNGPMSLPGIPRPSWWVRAPEALCHTCFCVLVWQPWHSFGHCG
jgi:branched-chain amino acid transport system permease protein